MQQNVNKRASDGFDSGAIALMARHSAECVYGFIIFLLDGFEIKATAASRKSGKVEASGRAAFERVRWADREKKAKAKAKKKEGKREKERKSTK